MRRSRTKQAASGSRVLFQEYAETRDAFAQARFVGAPGYAEIALALTAEHRAVDGDDVELLEEGEAARERVALIRAGQRHHRIKRAFGLVELHAGIAGR